jgi:hypothetical protein
MGLFAFRRLREREALATAGAFFSMAEPEPKLEVVEEQPAPKRRRAVKSKPESTNGDRN